ncbi:MAG: hypothetical protein GPJ54_11110 [Candidatus Heimdallarchaeota archaeon]|nr:hypothetical protein [Candidatus Heimdallarchaeota archaeon]
MRSDKMVHKTKQSLMLIIFLLFTVSLLRIVPEATLSVENNDLERDPVELITDTLIDSDGNYIIAGQTVNKNIYLVKYNTNGEIIWEKYIGGNNSDIVESILLDSDNNLIVVGETQSDDFPVTENAFQSEFGGVVDIFVSKISPKGQELWTTFIGGSDKDGFQPYTDGLIVRSDNVLVIWGWTWSDNFPVTSNAIQKTFAGGSIDPLLGIPAAFGGNADGFVVQINPDGDIDWSTYLGGYGQEHFNTVRFDHENNLLVLGSSTSDDYPVLNAIQPNNAGGRDLVISKFSNTGEIIWSTFLGGPFGYEAIISIEIDDDNYLYLSAWTKGGFPMTDGAFQAEKGGSRDNMLAKISPEGNLEWSTYLGGIFSEGYPSYLWQNGADFDDFADNMGEMSLDSKGNLIFVGISESPDYPLKNEIQNSKSGIYDIVVSKFDNDGQLIFSTFLGGNSEEDQVDLFIDSQDNIIITGNTFSQDFPVENAIQGTNAGRHDTFITKFNPAGELLWSTYFGAENDETLVNSGIDQNDNIILLGITNSETLYTTDNSVYNNLTDGFITKFDSDGKIVWSSYLGSTGVEKFNRFSLIIDAKGNSYVTGTSSTDLTGIDKVVDLAYASRIESNGEISWNQRIGTSAPNKDNFPFEFILAILSALTLALFFSTSYYMKGKRIENLLLNANMEKILQPVFNSNPSIIYVFIANNFIEDGNLEKEIKDEIPKEIFDFKFLLHPVKLSILKILYENVSIISAELRTQLGISWSELTSHLKKLTQKRYIIVEIKFVEGSLKNVVSMEPHGIKEFERLQKALLEFIDSSPHINRYLDQIDQDKKRSVNDDLYPPDE